MRLELVGYMITALCGLIAVGATIKLVQLCIEAMQAPPEDKKGILQRARNTVIVLIVSFCVGGTPVIVNIINHYYK